MDRRPGKKSGWGGARKGAGRPRKTGAPLPHVRRPALSQHHPVHVTLRIVRWLPSFRSEIVHERVRAALDAARKKDETERRPFQVVHYSVQADHVHLIVEARHKKALRSGVVGLEVRMARAVNRLLFRSGRVFADRYHRHDLRSSRETRNALVYVLQNITKHARVIGGPVADPWSSAASFDGCRGSIEVCTFSDTEPWAPVRARTWLLRSGWRTRGGRISPWERPAAAQRSKRR